MRVTDRAGVSEVTAALRGLREPVTRPWGFISTDERKALSMAWNEVREQIAHEPDGTPRRCQDGACGACGIALSVEWIESPLTWTDGSRSPMCSWCAAVWERAGAPTDLDRIRAVLESAMAGVRMQAGDELLGLKLYCDLAGESRGGFDLPWTYAPGALKEIRRRVEDRHPQFVTDPDKQEMALLRQRVRRSRARAASAEQSRLEAPGADIDWR
jgi:hypothetical protein